MNPHDHHKNRRHRHGASSRSPGAQTDPRHKYARWLRLFLVLAALSFCAYWSAQQLLAPGYFPLRFVALASEPRYLNRDLIRELNRYYLGKNFFAIDIRKVQNAVAEDPWIAAAKVRRVWPDGLEIHVREREVFARWSDEELLDIHGERFFPITLPPAAVEESRSWPQVTGPDGQEHNLLLSFQEASALLADIGLGVTRLEQDQRWAWSLVLSNDIKLKLGRKDFRQRLQRFISVYPDFLAAQDQQIAAIDLRYRNGFAVRWVKAQNSDSVDAKTIAHSKGKQHVIESESTL